MRDVAGHLSLVPVITTGQLLAAGPRARFDLNRINTHLGRQHGSAPPAEIVARIREHADRRRTARPASSFARPTPTGAPGMVRRCGATRWRC